MRQGIPQELPEGRSLGVLGVSEVDGLAEEFGGALEGQGLHGLAARKLGVVRGLLARSALLEMHRQEPGIGGFGALDAGCEAEMNVLGPNRVEGVRDRHPDAVVVGLEGFSVAYAP
jgi:hypothetical protein